MRDVVLTPAEMRNADRRAIAAGTPGIELMRRAGAAVAEAAAARLDSVGRVLVLCGRGNNGGDGYVAASLLAASGHAVTAARLGLPPAGGDAAEAASLWTGPVADASEPDPGAFDLVVDALFGTGLSRDLDGDAAALLDRLGRSGTPVLAVDIPSGVDAVTGAVRGAAVRAVETVVFAALKPGHLLEPGRRHAGAVRVVDIGVAAEPGAPALFVNGPALWRAALPAWDAAEHKYDRGHALCVSGSAAHTGAARLAARGALRAGAGLVSVVTSVRALAVNAAHLTAIMMRVCDDPDEFSDLLTDDRFNALLLGPALGIGESTRDWVAAALEADRGTVLDADALTSFSGEAAALAALVRAPREHPVVLTPHGGEFARLFAGRGEADAEALAVVEPRSKVERARAAAAFTGATVVLKGPDTVIAEPDGRAAINANGSPFLATAGSGDVLGGIVAGLLARGTPAFEAACAAVWLHAEAAARFGPGLIAEDLPEMLPAIWRDLADAQ